MKLLGVLRHVAPAGEPFGLPSPNDVDELLRLDHETEALDASTEEIHALLHLLGQPRHRL